jgi:prepilin-type N-terminal cleavage/methylation domain-containing protein
MLLKANRSIQFGFTLIEVAVVLVIVGLLLAGGINLMSSSADTARYKQTQSDMQEVKEALITFYIQNHFLPCPDQHNNPTNASYGRSDYTAGSVTAGGTCANNRGWLPHIDLGVGGNGDGWGERYRYVVSGDSTNFFSNKQTSCNYTRPGVPTANTIRIQDLNTGATIYVAEWSAFSLISTGKNGQQTNAGVSDVDGAFNASGGYAGLNQREQENDDNDSTLRYGTQVSDGTNVLFDDMVVWVGDMQLISELRKSGVCTFAGGNDPRNRTTADLTANPGKTVLGNYNAASAAIPVSSGDDKAVITGNMNKSLDLQDGNNTLDVQGNANGAITAGTGDDIVRVKGNLTQAANLGAGNDYLEVWGDANATIDMGAGDDGVRIEGNMTQNVSLGAGANAIYVGGNVNADISAVGGTAIVYLSHYSSLSSVPAAIRGDATLTLKCNVSSAWVMCA